MLVRVNCFWHFCRINICFFLYAVAHLSTPLVEEYNCHLEYTNLQPYYIETLAQGNTMNINLECIDFVFYEECMFLEQLPLSGFPLDYPH